jgi:23S rRNA (adenine2503-C2)-methyltransferase
MTDLSADLRCRLKSVARIDPPEIFSFHESSDGSCKWLVEVQGGSKVEAVFIPDKGRGTLCVSSQAGCAVDCSFCATGKQGFNKNLTSDEIVGQLWLASQHFREMGSSGRIISNVVLMGMGEPLLNFDNVVESVNLFMCDFAYGLSKRRVTLSTSGIVPMLDKLSEVTDVSLAVSLHAPVDELRDVLVPVNKKYPIGILLASVRRYLNAMPDIHRRVTIEYTLIKDCNDQDQHAIAVADLLRDVPCKINLIPFNPFSGVAYEKPSLDRIRRFQKILINEGYTATIRSTRGDDIAAACGQLSGEIKDRTKRTIKYASIM